MSYARQPPQNTPNPYPSPAVNHVQQPQAGPQAPPPQQQQHGQGQAIASGHGGQGGGSQTPGQTQAQNHAPPYPQHPHAYQQAQHPQTHPQARVRDQVVSILATTTNQCLADLGYKPGQDHARLQQLEQENTRIQDDNRKLYEDNTRLIELLKAEQQKLELANLSQTQQAWINNLADLQIQIADLKSEKQRIATRCSELETHNQALQAQIASRVANTPTNVGIPPSATERAYSDLLVKYQNTVSQLKIAEQRVQLFLAHGRVCPTFQHQFSEYVTWAPQRTSSQGQTPVPPQQQPYPVPGNAPGVQSAMPQQQHALTQHQLQQRRASAPVSLNGQRPPSQPGTPFVASPSNMTAPAVYFGGRPPMPHQNGSSLSRPSSTQPGTPAYYYATPSGIPVTQMGPPPQGHVRTPSQQFGYMNGTVGNGLNGIPQAPSSRPSSNVPIANMNMNPQAQAVLHARQQQQQQQVGSFVSPGPVQQPTSAQPSTPGANPAQSPAPQIFSNALMHSNSNPILQQQLQPQNRAHSRPPSVISVSSSSSRPNSAASTVRPQQGQQQQQQQQQHQTIQPRPQFQTQSHGAPNWMTLQQHHIVQGRSPSVPGQEPLRSDIRSQSQLHFQRPSQPSTPLVPVPPSPGTQPPPPSGSTDGSFAEYQSFNVPLHQVGVSGRQGTPSGVPPASAREGSTPASISKRGSVVLGEDDEESRKKMKMSVDSTPVGAGGQGQEGQVQAGGDPDVTMTNVNGTEDAPTVVDSSLPLVRSPVQVEAGGEEDADEEDDEEDEDPVGPDGLRTVKSCLESFFLTEGEERTCRMCLKRYEKNLIPFAVSFTAAEDQVLVDHCLAEHGEVWDKLRQDV